MSRDEEAAPLPGPAAGPAGAAPPPRGPGCLSLLFRLALAAALLLALALLGALLAQKSLLAPHPLGGDERGIRIFDGDSVRRVVARLQDARVIRSGEPTALLLRGLIRLRGVDAALKPGEYRFTGEVTLQAVVASFERGAAEPVHRVTLPEGLTAAETARRLAAAPLVDAAAAPELIRGFDPRRSGFALGTVEGILFPETYHFGPRTTADQILGMMMKGFRGALPEGYEVRLLELDLTLAEAVTLASIVEREARIEADRPLIAAVFLNRLAKGMKLESCATVMYALGGWRERLLISDTRTASPYNTYLNPGLPPTPICSPGRSALRAVFAAPATDFLYFVARGDGGHVFSKTFAEHQKAIRRIRSAGERGRR